MAQRVELTEDRLAELIQEAEEAHAEYEEEELGGERDEKWPVWYAQYIVEQASEN
jgi:hypothetical protein